MGINYGTKIVREGLVLHLDAANPKSYPGMGNTWIDLSANNNDATLYSSAYEATSKGGITMTGSGYFNIPFISLKKVNRLI